MWTCKKKITEGPRKKFVDIHPLWHHSNWGRPVICLSTFDLTQTYYEMIWNEISAPQCYLLLAPSACPWCQSKVVKQCSPSHFFKNPTKFQEWLLLVSLALVKKWLYGIRYCLPRHRSLTCILMSLINNKLEVLSYFFTAGPYALIMPSEQASAYPFSQKKYFNSLKTLPMLSSIF